MMPALVEGEEEEEDDAVIKDPLPEKLQNSMVSTHSKMRASFQRSRWSFTLMNNTPVCQKRVLKQHQLCVIPCDYRGIMGLQTRLTSYCIIGDWEALNSL